MNTIELQMFQVHLGAFQLGPLTCSFPAEGLSLIRGPNGSGKTTFLRSLLGQYRTQRQGKILGLKGPHLSVGIESLLFGNWTVNENFIWFGKLLDQSLPADNPLLDRLQKVWNKKVDHLSAGWRRQAELSFLLSSGRANLFLDEPLNPVDRDTKRFFADQIQRFSENSGKLVMLTTHNEEELVAQPLQVLQL